jgi:glycerol-3-phosphate dehydrogenase
MKTRTQSLELAQTKEFDVVIVGGGIAGAGIAQDAASRGLSVLLLEKEDFASGTSSRTTKLVHGGLRYLEQLHFKLTRELCHERGLLEQLAPHMVRDFSFVMPLPRNDLLFSLKAEVGLTLYDILSWPITSHFHKRLGQQEVLEAAPALATDKFRGGLRFHDCITDDSRLVLEVVKSACHHGALAVNYMEVRGFDIEDDSIKAVQCHDRYSGQDIVFRTRSCVNAAGVWSDVVCRMVEPGWSEHVAPSKGIHIIVPQSAFETNTALFLPTQDKRYVFVVPWQRALMIGTTDRRYDGELDRPLPNGDEIDYLLSVINSYTNTYTLNRSDIVGSFAGLRPLVQQQSTDGSTKNMSREHVIFSGPGGMIGLTGGKLTNYRIMAVEVIDRIFKKLPDAQYKESRTARMMLGGWKDKNDFLTVTATMSAKARKLSIEPATLDHLISTYGADAQQIIDIIEKDSSLNERICPDFPPVMAEIPFCVYEEMVVSLEDLMMRRLRLGILHQRQCIEAAPKVAQMMQILLRWDDARLRYEVNALERILGEHLQLVMQPA